MPTDLRDWLLRHGLAHLQGVLSEAGVDLDVLGDLSEHDLAGLGLSLGDRKRLLKAVAASMPEACSGATGGTSPGAGPAPTAPALLPAHPDAQRRQVTVMFCDMVGSTSLSTQLDPEDFADLIGRYHVEVSRRVHESGGFVAQLLGDGVLAYFGYPRASEDDAERAVRTGLMLTRQLRAVATQDSLTPAVAVRVGVATGTVVVGERGVQGRVGEPTAVGDTPNLAARLQALADPGQVLIAASTRRLVGELFELQDRGVHPLKGFEQPVRVWQALGERQDASRFHAYRAASLSPLVGRDGELQVLVDRWERATQGESQVVLISGEPGIGKSRIGAALCQRVQALAQQTGPWTLLWQCSPLHRGTPMYPVAQQLRQAALRREEPGTSELEHQLQRAEIGLEVKSRVLRLAGLGQLGEELSGHASVDRVDTQHALVETLAALARTRPLMLLVEDAHWIDPSTAELLTLCIRNLRDQRLLMVVTARPGYELGGSEWPHLTRLVLGRMSQHQCVELAQRVALETTRSDPGRPSLPSHLLHQIVQRTDGVPLFVEELTRAVLESGPPEGASDASMLAIPSTLQDSLMARLDRLQPDTREVAQAASVIGREFEESLLRELMLPMQPEQVEQALQELQRTGLVQRFSSGDRPVGSFKHALVRDAAYGSLLKGPRAARHAGVVRALEAVFPHVSVHQPELLAAHHQQAGEHARALDRWRDAGDLAFSRSSLTEAADHYRAAIALCGTVQAPAAVVFHLQMQLSAVLTQVQGYASEEGLQAARHALALSQAPELAEHRVEAVRAVATILVSRARIDETRQLLADAQSMQADGEGPRAEASRLWVLGAAEVVAGRFGDARHHLCVALERVEALGEGQFAVQWHGANPRVATLSWLERALMYLGRLDEGFARAQESLVLARRTQHPPTLTWVLLNLVGWYHMAGRRQEAADLAREAIDLAQRHQIRSRIGVGRVMQGRALVLGGRVTEGAAMMRSGIDLWLETCSVLTATLLVTGPAWAMASAGDAKSVQEYLEIGERLLRDTQERAGQAELMRVRAWLQRNSGDHDAARSTLRGALAVAESQESLLFALRVVLDLVELDRGGRYESAAREDLRRIYGRFNEGFGFTVLQQARRILDEPPIA